MPAGDLDAKRILDALVDENVEFVVVGGLAMVAQGSAHVTTDIDICYNRSTENLTGLCRALLPLRPTLRGAPAGLPFRLDAPTLRAGLNFTLETEAGDLDLLGEVSGLGFYGDALAGSVKLELFGHSIAILSIDSLIKAKSAAGRAKDKLHLLELEELRKLTRK